ncbi:hypothetical protein D4764_18G0012280 [Takifugu flavidus]|uniref:Uncharacterized protein n=1 Tax=Takifugu flavidus TaxID=433684 RepID=A0A5C6NSC4_9TELE|nr:hypothetical protein D4764_18G0012280 [Takifugu flavidus]
MTTIRARPQQSGHSGYMYLWLALATHRCSDWLLRQRAGRGRMWNQLLAVRYQQQE